MARHISGCLSSSVCLLFEAFSSDGFLTGYYYRTHVRFCFSAVCDFLLVPQTSLQPLNGYAPNSHGRRVWSLARMSLNVSKTSLASSF